MKALFEFTAPRVQVSQRFQDPGLLGNPLGNTLEKVQFDLLLTLGIPTGPYMKQASERALSQFESTLAGLSQTEISIKRVPLLANISQINDDHWRLICGEVVRVHRDWSTTYEKLYRPQTRKYFATGVEVSEEDLMQLRSNQAAVRRDIQAIMDRRKCFKID